MQHVDSTVTKPTSAYIPVSPEIAERWMAGNTVNRTVRDGKVRQYANDMNAGRWMQSNDAICFDANGKLLNGQHRLKAVVSSGQTITFLVVRNLSPETMTAMDQGTARTASDAFGFAGEKNTALLAAAARLALLCQDGRIYQDTRNQRVSHGELLDFVDTHPTLRQTVLDLRPIVRTIEAAPSTALAAHWLITEEVGPALATVYFRQLASRANEPSGSAVLAVDSRLREVRRNRTNYPQRNYIYLFIKGWNHYARDGRVQTLAMSPRRGTKFALPPVAAWQRPEVPS